MDFEFTPEQKSLREEVRAFLEEERRRGSFIPKCDSWQWSISREFSRKLGERGYIGMTFPREYGGGGKGFVDRLIVTEELLKYGAPVAGHWIADRQIGASLLAYGSEEQRREFLPRIAKGEIFFCAGMSEPEAGSDLASLKTRAVDKGDHFVINGQKIWTTIAHEADYIYLIARTDPEAPKHRGLSEFIIDMKTPGITIRPIYDMRGGHHFNEVFFDDVKVPKDMLVGEKNKGWYQITPQLDYERSGIERLMSNYILFDAIKGYMREKGIYRDKYLLTKLSELLIEFEVGKLLVYRCALMLDSGKVPNYESSCAKVFCTSFEQRLSNFAMDILGLKGALQKGELIFEWASDDYLSSPNYTIQGGTSEILRNIVAMRGLGLPSK